LAAILFWLSAATLAYTYAGYPIVLAVLRVLRPKRHRINEDYRPLVSFIIAAYNEEAAIAGKLDNTLALEYPRERLQIIVTSDGSTDETNEIVAGYQDRGVTLLAWPKRTGKIAAVARAVEQADGEVIVFSDATGIYGSGALHAMVRHFADERVGGVGGEVRYVAGDSVVGEGTGAYWRYEKLVKQLQSDAFSNTTISGAIHATRKDLFVAAPPETGSDMIVPMSIVKEGHLVVYEPGAVASEATTVRAADETAMRVRIPVRGFASMARSGGAMNPFKHPAIFFHVASHKALRWLAGFFMLTLMISNAVLVLSPAVAPSASSSALVPDLLFYQIVLASQVVFYMAALVGYILRDRAKSIFTIPYYFCLLNFAALVGFVQFLAGRRIARWEPAR